MFGGYKNGVRVFNVEFWKIGWLKNDWLKIRILFQRSHSIRIGRRV